MCSDPTRTFYPQRTICYATRQKVAAQELYASLHSEDTGRVYHNGDESSWSSTRSYETPIRYDAGVYVWVADTDVNPDDKFLSRPDDDSLQG